MGTYILEATNQDVIEKLNFTLDVLGIKQLFRKSKLNKVATK